MGRGNRQIVQYYQLGACASDDASIRYSAGLSSVCVAILVGAGQMELLAYHILHDGNHSDAPRHSDEKIRDCAGLRSQRAPGTVLSLYNNHPLAWSRRMVHAEQERATMDRDVLFRRRGSRSQAG